MNNIYLLSDKAPSSAPASQQRTEHTPWYERISEMIESILRALSQAFPSEAAGSGFGYSVTRVTPSAPSALKGCDATTTAYSPIAGKTPAAPAATMNPRQDKDYSEGFHYVVKRNGETVADIVGTLHADDQSVSRLNPTVEEAAKKARWIAFEAMYPDDELIPQILSSKIETEKAYQEYNKDNINLDLKNYKYEPCYTMSTKKIKFEPRKGKGTENLILKLRRERSQNMIIYLETLKESAEMNNFAHLMNETLKQKIQEGIISKDDLTLVGNDDGLAYRNGDERTENKTHWLKNLDPAGHVFLITRRNYILADRSIGIINKACTKDRALIAFGYVHLFGEDGVIKLLSNFFEKQLEKNPGQKYTIERVRSSTPIQCVCD